MPTKHCFAWCGKHPCDCSRQMDKRIASAIEARSAKTEGLGPQDESAVAKPDAQPSGQS